MSIPLNVDTIMQFPEGTYLKVIFYNGSYGIGTLTFDYDYDDGELQPYFNKIVGPKLVEDRTRWCISLYKNYFVITKAEAFKLILEF